MVVLGRQRPFKRHRLIFFFNDHHLSSCRRPVNQGEMSVGSRRPTVSKQLRNYADNTPLSPGGKKILTAISIAKSKLVSKIFDPIFGRRKKKKEEKFLRPIRRCSIIEILKSVRLGEEKGEMRVSSVEGRSFFWRQLFVVIRSKHPSASLFRRRPMPSVTHHIAGRKLSTSHSPRFQTLFLVAPRRY